MTEQSTAQRHLAIDSYRQLIDFLANGARAVSEWGIGAEMEKLVLDADTGEAADYAQIELLLTQLAENSDWHRVFEGDHLIGLIGQHSSVTLEPGGQLELSGQLCSDLFCNCDDFSRHIRNASRACQRLGLVLLGLGVQPFSRLDQIEWMPKARYDIMGPYMSRTGDMGQRMMKQSAGLQVNLDFADEADCMRKMRLAQELSPLLYALFANSPLMDGKASGFLTTRGEIWARTDPDRCGLLPFLDKADAGFTDYVDYALDVPMYFIVRDGRYLDLTARRFTFRDYLERGHDGHFATLADWDLHLSTLFTEVRLRPQIEVRCADSLPPHLVMSVAALLKGLMYDDESLDAARALCRTTSHAETAALSRAAWRTGLRTPWRDASLLELARECVALARAGLDRQQALTGKVYSEARFLDSLEPLLASGETLAEQLLRKWHGSREERLRALKEHCAFLDIAPRPNEDDCADAQP
jgi:glutamate--cysteine ligase